jgi:hypothetical protein
MNRRAWLTGALWTAGGIVVAGSAAGGWRAWSVGMFDGDPAPWEPWQAFGAAQPGDPLGLVAAAILASNPHNTQPWRFRVTADAIRIEADTARHLGAFDPYRREMWTGLGCAVENIRVAAPGLGFSVGEPVVDAGGDDGAGSITLALAPASPMAHPLAAQINQRRTHRGLYAPEPMDPAVLDQLRRDAGEVAGARWIALDPSSKEGKAFADANIAATAAIVADEQMGRDGDAWTRPNPRVMAKHRDGVGIPTAGLSPFVTTMAQMLPPQDPETAGGFWLNSVKGQMEASAGFGLITVADLYDRAGQVSAGRLWQRIHLAITQAGLAAQPHNQLPEMVDRDRQLGRAPAWAPKLAGIAGPDERATFCFRFGRAQQQVPHSPRRDIRDVVV